MRKVVDFLTGVKVELMKVSWPTPSLTVKLTVIVILVTVIVGFFLGGIDYLLTILLERLLKQ